MIVGDIVARFSTWVALQLIYGEAISDIEKLFSLAGYQFMPIKGAYLIRTGLSASVENRKMVDIDLLIPESQFESVCNWFSTLGNVECRDNYWEFERSFVYTLFGNPIYMEFHRLINFPARFLLPNEVLFARGKRASESCILPDPVDVLLIHICHKLAHVIDGFEEQFYREIELYSLQSGFSWDVFWKRVPDTGIYNFVWLVIEEAGTLKHMVVKGPIVPSWYAMFLAKNNLFMKGKRALIRRVFFEFPFVRNVFKLSWYKLKNHRRYQRLML